MVAVLNKKGFKLPWIQTEQFNSLIHFGLDYNRQQCIYSIKSYNNIEKLTETLSAILKTEVVFLQTCTRCGKDFACSNCKYGELCTSKDLPFSCVCPQCLRDRKQYEEYLTKF